MTLPGQQPQGVSSCEEEGPIPPHHKAVKSLELGFVIGQQASNHHNVTVSGGRAPRLAGSLSRCQDVWFTGIASVNNLLYSGHAPTFSVDQCQLRTFYPIPLSFQILVNCVTFEVNIGQHMSFAE
ncbi:hypothetical protein CB1_000283013 [Camelus ferus]|nr:hypothetical protein CB1_000283013 [Camelus ferus]